MPHSDEGTYPAAALGTRDWLDSDKAGKHLSPSGIFYEATNPPGAADSIVVGNSRNTYSSTKPIVPAEIKKLA